MLLNANASLINQPTRHGVLTTHPRQDAPTASTTLWIVTAGCCRNCSRIQSPQLHNVLPSILPQLMHALTFPANAFLNQLSLSLSVSISPACNTLIPRHTDIANAGKPAAQQRRHAATHSPTEARPPLSATSPSHHRLST